MSRELGVLVKTQNKTKEKIKSDTNYIIKIKSVKTKISVKDAVSDILIEADFEKKNIKLLVNIDCPATGTNTSKINWLVKQLNSAKKKSSNSFDKIYEKTYVSASIKYARNNLIYSLPNIEELKGISKTDEISGFQLYVVDNLGKQFTSKKGFVSRIEKLTIEYYDAYVQDLSNWTKPAPRIDSKSDGVRVIIKEE